MNRKRQDRKKRGARGKKKSGLVRTLTHEEWKKKIEDGEIFHDDEGRPLDPADDFYPEHAKLEKVKDKSVPVPERRRQRMVFVGIRLPEELLDRLDAQVARESSRGSETGESASRGTVVRHALVAWLRSQGA